MNLVVLGVSMTISQCMGSSVLVVYGFHKGFNDFIGNRDFCLVIWFPLFWLFLGYEWTIYIFVDLMSFHDSSIVHGF